MLSIYLNSENSKDFSVKQSIKKEKPKETKPIFELKTTENKYSNFISKYYTVDFDSIKGINYVNDYTKGEINIDRKIDNTKQVKNDCWLLAGINALGNTTKGEKYLKNTISKRNYNNTVIYFKGTNTSVTIPQIALNAAKQSNKYVKGDDDMLAIELATEYYKKMLISNKEAMKNKNPNIINGKHTSGNFNDPLAGGFPSDILFLITGKKSTTYFNENNSNLNYIKILINKIKENPDKYAITCNFKEKRNGLYIHHAYTLKKVDDNFVTLINPHNSGNEENIPINDFYENINSLTLLEL